MSEIEWIEDPRPQRHGWAPGDYIFRCLGCKHNGGEDRHCIGDKRATMCADCAYALPDQVPRVLQLPIIGVDGHVEYSASRGLSKVTVWVTREEGDRVHKMAMTGGLRISLGKPEGEK